MNKYKIKFSHNYSKLWNQKEAWLLNVKNIWNEDLNKDLIEYDTKTIEGAYYPLPTGQKLHLTFLGDKLIPFCTIRRWSEEKEKYYRQIKGSLFDIVITENLLESEKVDELRKGHSTLLQKRTVSHLKTVREEKRK